ncbi:hypothetical protein ASQ44_03790 [Rickettsia rhipicephali]|uniref:hypothetical protein n=1 Tax=Rickettsia rhipicephali TaxID=33992 RepID=UPI00070CAA5A|nr:hypothetical protein [Rickettsia rhipicephali]ALN41247.1 hypothetical protein ASQ44_03790 [Rickettsia rhipicephali]
MPPTIEVTDLIVNINGYFSNIDANTKTQNLRKIKLWFSENGLDRYYDSNKSKISATYLAHILKIYKKSIFDRDIVQQKCLEQWLKKDAEAILDFFRSEEDTEELYDEFIKYKNKYYPEQLSTQAIRELNSKMNEALGYLGVTSIDKNLLITQQEILQLIREKRLDTIKEYLKDIGKSTRINANITKDKVKDLFKDSVLAEHIQSYIEVTSQNNPEVNDDRVADPDFDANNPNDFDRTDETYKSFLKDTKSLQSRYDNLNKQDARAIDKALWVLASTDKQRDKVFEELKEYRTDKLKINLSVIEEKNKFKIQVSKLERITSGHENNHVVPVSVFLKSLKYSISNQEFNNIKEIFGKLCYFYGKDYEKSVIFEFLRDKIVNTRSISNADLRLLLEDSIIPFIYSHWNERAEATYKLAKTHKSFGEEGNRIRGFNEKLEDIYHHFSQKSFRQFKTVITKIAQDYFKILDIQGNNIGSERFNVIVGDAIEVLRIWLKLFEQSGNEILSSHTQQDEYKTWKKKYLTKKEFGTKLIEAQKLGKVEEDKWKKDWEEYVLQHPDISVDERSSEGASSLDNIIFGLEQGLLSPGRSDSDSSMDTDQEELYNKENIEKILSNGISDNLVDVDIVEYDDDLDEVQKTQRIEQLKQEQQTRLIKELKQNLLALQSSQITEKFYVIGLKSDTQKVISASIIKIILANNIPDIKILPLIMHEYSRKFYDKINDDSNLGDSEVSICNRRQCGSLINKEELDISKFVEVARLRIQHIDSQVGIIQTEIDSILEMPTQSLETKHKIIIEGNNSDRNVESGQDGSRVSTGEQPGTSEVGVLKRKGDSVPTSEKNKSSSPKKKVRFYADDVKNNMKNFEEFKQQAGSIALTASTKSCAASSRKRKTRDICQEEDLESFYDPLEEHIQESIRINSRLYINLAYLFSLQYRDNMPQNIKLDNVISYAQNIGDIINEGEVNRSTREQELLKVYYQEAQEFFSKYSKDNLFALVTKENKPITASGYLFTNGQQTLLVSDHDNYYQLYSQDYNYRLLFQTKDVNFLAIKNLAKKFFQWCSGGNTEYKIFTLSKNLPQDVIIHLTQAPFWTPDNVVSDLVLLNKEHAGSIESIPSEVVRELFFLNNKTPNIKLLDQDFFQLNKDGITFRADILHKVLPSLTEQQIQALGDVIKKYDLSLDTQCLDLIPESNKNLLQNYNNKILNQLKSSEVLNFDKISQLSWETLNHEFETGSFEGINYKDIIPKEIREKSLNHFQDLHTKAHSKFHVLKGAATQGAFLLPDIICSFNTGDPEGLIKTVGMIAGDMFLDKTLFSKLPITSPIFKIITFYSIAELHKKLNSLSPDSEEATIIKHQLGEQYFAVGLMFAEICGFETGPLWIGLMAEQMLYGAIALRNQYHLPDTSLWEAFLINLGFYQDELPIIFEERHLLDVQLKFLDGFNFPSAWVIVYIPDVKDVRWERINLKDIPSEVKDYIQANQSLACKSGFKIGPNNHVHTCEYAGFKKNKYTNVQDIWQQQIFDIISKNREIKFVPTKIHQEHNMFQNIQYSVGERINKEYIRIASKTIEQTNDPDVFLAQVARIEGGMSAIYFNLTTWGKCLSNGYAGPCSTRETVWLNGPYRHNIIMLFDPKVHSNTNIYFHPEGLNHLDKNYFSHVNNEYLAKEELDKCATDLNDYCFEHLKPNIPDTYSLLIVLYNVVYPNSVNFIRTTNNTKLRIEDNHNTNINTNYIIDANALKQVVPFEIYDRAHNMSITLSNIRQDNITNLALWQKLSSKNLGTSGYGIYFNSEEKLIIPGYKDSIAIFIIQPMGWYIEELILSVKYCNIINTEGMNYRKPGKIILEKIAAHDHSFDIQLINNMHIIDKNSKMELSIINCRADTAPIKYSKLFNNHFIIESCDALQPFNLNWPLSALFKIKNIMGNIVSFSNYRCEYTLKFSGNNMITITGILDKQPSNLELVIHNGKLYECILSVLPNNNELFVIEHVHYDQQIILAKSELDLTEIIEHKSHDIPTLRDKSYIAEYLKNGIILVFYSHGNIIKHHFLTDSPNINNITYSIKDGNVLCAKIENKHSIMNKDFIWYKSTIADNKKCLEFSTDIQNVSIINGRLNINGVDIVDMPKQMRIVSLGNIMPLSFFNNLVGINIIPQAEDQLEELLSSSTNPRLRRAIKQDKQNLEETASVTIDEQQININDELANSNTYNVARSSASILEPSFSFNNGLWHWVWNKLSNLSFKLLPEADTATLDNNKSFNYINKLIKQFNNHPSDTQIKKQNHETEAENNNIDNNENYNLYDNDIDNSKSSLSDYLLIDDPGNDQGNLQTVINSIDIPNNLSLLTLLIGQFFGTNKALSSNPYISPEQEKNRYINELNKTVKSALPEMETKYTNEELEDILPSLDILFNGQEELNYNNNSTSVLGKITEICNYVYDFFGYEAN